MSNEAECPNCGSPRMQGTGLYLCGEGIGGNVHGGCREYYTAKRIRTLATDLAAARQERDEAFYQQKVHKAFGEEQFARAEAAEAREKILKDTLEEIYQMVQPEKTPQGIIFTAPIRKMIRKVLDDSRLQV